MTERKGRTIGVVQPTYLPWLPFFERMAASDVFVLLDDVQYSKNTAFNRNAIKTAQGRLQLTIPVRYRGASSARIDEIEVDRNRDWPRKHWAGIAQAYAKAPYWPQFEDALRTYYHADHGPRLIDWTLPMIALLRAAFDLEQIPCLRSSALGVDGRGDERLAEMCRRLGGDRFIVKPGTEAYHPPAVFAARGVGFAYLPYTKVEYPQGPGPFEPGLSALDYLLRQGPGRPPFAARVHLTPPGAPETMEEGA